MSLQDPPSYYDDYDPNDVPEDQAAPAPETGYSYPVPDNPLVLRRRGKTLSSSSARRMSDKMMMMKKMTMKKERRPKELMMKNKMMHESMGMEEERMTHHKKSSSSGSIIFISILYSLTFLISLLRLRLMPYFQCQDRDGDSAPLPLSPCRTT